MKIKFTPIDSDHIQGAHYDPMEHKATIKFKGGYLYHVHGISPDGYQEFLDAPSQGEHYHNFIKNNYHIERVK